MEKLIAEHVINNLDMAIEQGWIEVYYQPVIRALTGKLCGMEALARWNDPHWGNLPPAKFIKPLEDNNLIYKLDCFIIDKVCEDLSYLVKTGQSVVPASINFSRLDFMKCDMFERVEEAIRKFDVPRDYIHIEITESIFVQDEGTLHEVVDKFRNAGYEIWMDDFGSGYSSLNLLKDYSFDMLKMDMIFLSSLTEKSKAILRSTITMAKDIGIKTLAEGVETWEQYEFLRNIGCEQLQGFYFGRPQPIDDMMAHLKEKNIQAEERQWRHFYEIAGFHVKDTDIPLEIIEDDGKSFHTLFINKPYRDQLLHAHDDGLELSEIDRIIYNPTSPLLQKYREFADITEKSNNIETFYYTDNGDYLRFRAKCLAKHNGHSIIKGSIINISLDQNTSERDMLDNKLRELNLLFEVVDLINIESNIIAPLLGRLRYLQSDTHIYSDLKEAIEQIADKIVYAPEKDDFKKYMDLSTLMERVENSKKGYLEKIFRLKQTDGTYKRKNIIIMTIPGAGGSEFLCCYKAVPDEIAKILDGLTASARSLVDKYLADKGLVTYSELWENMIWDSTIKFFWKDKDRRFLGASQAFLDFYGIKSLDEIVGKTDEDMRWHVADEPYMNDEIEVLKNGARVMDAKGQCIVSGVVHEITCQKMPIYRNGEIVGLVGFFQDRDEELYRLENLALPSNVDSVTRLMNAKALFISMMDYAVEYSDKGKNYGLIVMRNSKHARIMKSYGSDVAEKLLAEIGRRIIEVTGQSCAVARTKESIFTVLTYVKTREALAYLAESIRKSVESITKIDGNSVTVMVDISFVLRSDEGVSDENIYPVALDKVMEIEEEEGI
ncbi:EAL domain-containing protein [Butyrivibrio sp. VCD2006]|uniref:EAL domain-containing protein n=1 Tax=Butyrivibrio sp. VCD2006 TaxID=1280664 RepID=UPI0003FCB583|nr:EAL domain-containing protein [Butyrivibrio sp. VCD2006]